MKNNVQNLIETYNLFFEKLTLFSIDISYFLLHRLYENIATSYIPTQKFYSNKPIFMIMRKKLIKI